MTFIAENNSHNLAHELEWLEACIERRMQEYAEDIPFFLYELVPPELNQEGSPFAEFIYEHRLTAYERLILILAISVHLRPGLMNTLIATNKNGRPSSDSVLFYSEEFSGFIPTGATALYISVGRNVHDFTMAGKIFDTDHIFYTKNILRLDSMSSMVPELRGLLSLSRDWKDYFLLGMHRKPAFSSEFPAKEIHTSLALEDLVISSLTRKKIDTVLKWLQHKKKLATVSRLDKYKKSGYRVLFHGSPGTGKTVTASIIGQLTGQSVYRIDLSMVVSKYVGETEKNLSKLFDTAESKGWILFFDEADALFSQRTEDIKTSNDRYANQEVSFLLQRIEDYDGLVILGSNFMKNIDHAFMRRFDGIIPFYLPDKEQTLELWKKVLPQEFILSDQVDLEEISGFYSLSAAQIVNIMNYIVLEAMDQETGELSREIFMDGIREELEKAGKPFMDPRRLPHTGKLPEQKLQQEQKQNGTTILVPKKQNEVTIVSEAQVQIRERELPQNNSMLEDSIKYQRDKEERMKRNIEGLHGYKK